MAATPVTAAKKRLVRQWKPWKPTFGAPNGAPATDSPISQAHQEAVIWRLRSLLSQVMSGGTDREFVALLNTVAGNAAQIELGLVAWIDLIEVLVQDAEQRYGSAPHQGALKAADVRAVALYLLRPGRLSFDLPNIPPELEPFVSQVVVQWSVDAVVEIANTYGLWVDTSPEPAESPTLRWLTRLFSPVLRALGAAALWLWEHVHPTPRLDPALQRAVDKVEKEALIAQRPEVLHTIGATITWIGTHRTQLVAAVHLVAAVVNEAESFVLLSGPDKKAYAHNLVFAVLAEAGLRIPDGLIHAKLGALIDGAIEALVHLFNKHERFGHRAGVGQ